MRVDICEQSLNKEEKGTEFCFRKLKFITIYNAYSIKSPFKYYISILGGVGVWGHAYCQAQSQLQLQP